MNAQVRYISIVTERPEVLASFYQTHLAMKELGTGEHGDISLTDGFYNLTLLKQRPGLEEDGRLGLNHVGIAVDDIREVEARLEEFAPNADIRQESGDLHHGEYRVFDPNGIAVSLSTRAFHVPERGPVGLPSIHHVAYSVPKNQEVLDFFRNVFGFREPTSSWAQRAEFPDVRFAADGNTAMAILMEPSKMIARGDESARDIRYGLNHFGFVVTDMEAIRGNLPFDVGLGKRPENRPMAEFRAYDPDGNPFDISCAKGFEVDVDVWLRGTSAPAA